MEWAHLGHQKAIPFQKNGLCPARCLNSGVTYRLYAANDFPQLSAIEEICFQPPHRFSRAYMRHLVRAANAATWVAEEDGRIVGFAIVEWAEESDLLIAYIQTIEVTPTHRGRGIAGELMRRIEDSAHAAGAPAIWLHAEAGNQPAIRLYEANGYLCRGREDGYYGRGRAALIYVKSLPGERVRSAD
jgi:[ribosomal protein S18]-alanine N-acetyltransferase